MQPRSSKALDVTSLASLLAAVALAVPFIERLFAAAWQWYKFAGYSNDGHISLSLSAGWVFSGVLAAVYVFALALNRAAHRRAAVRAMAWSRWAMYIAATVAIAYWLLGVSSLNAWRA